MENEKLCISFQKVSSVNVDIHFWFLVISNVGCQMEVHQHEHRVTIKCFEQLLQGAIYECLFYVSRFYEAFYQPRLCQIELQIQQVFSDPSTNVRLSENTIFWFPICKIIGGFELLVYY